MDKSFVAYYRVSTRQQGISGLGLDSQRQIVESFIKHNGNRIVDEFTEIESGRVDDRPMLQKAISTSKMNGATLVIAKLDRLSRSVSFISNLMESQVKFICCDIPEANELTIHIFAALAEWERKRISERTRDALKAKKVREPDWRAGTNNLTDEGRKKAHTTNYNKARTDRRVRHAYHFIQPLYENGHTYQYIADRLNDEGYVTRKGCSFHAQQVYILVQRFKLGQDKKGAHIQAGHDVFSMD